MRKVVPAIPTAADWGKIDSDDLDLRASHEIYFGKSCADLEAAFLRTPIAMIEGLRWMPLRPFVFYLRCMADFVLRCPTEAGGAPDLASSFLGLIEEKARTCPLGIRANMESVRCAVVFISENQSSFRASREIYGDFQARRAVIETLFRTI